MISDVNVVVVMCCCVMQIISICLQNSRQPVVWAESSVIFQQWAAALVGHRILGKHCQIVHAVLVHNDTRVELV